MSLKKGIILGIIGITVIIVSYYYFDVSPKKQIGKEVKKGYKNLVSNEAEIFFDKKNIKARKHFEKAIEVGSWELLDDYLLKEIKEQELGVELKCILGIQASYIQRMEIAKLASEETFSAKKYDFVDINPAEFSEKNQEITKLRRKLALTSTETLEACDKLENVHAVNMLYFLSQIAFTKPKISGEHYRKRIYEKTIEKMDESIQNVRKANETVDNEKSREILDMEGTVKFLENTKSQYMNKFGKEIE